MPRPGPRWPAAVVMRNSGPAVSEAPREVARGWRFRASCAGVGFREAMAHPAPGSELPAVYWRRAHFPCALARVMVSHGDTRDSVGCSPATRVTTRRPRAWHRLHEGLRGCTEVGSDLTIALAGRRGALEGSGYHSAETGSHEQHPGKHRDRTTAGDRL